ncbi:nitrogen fixation protein FixH [Rhodobacter capsulatus]|jgi:nitrogen fixation protein FixH|uniref:Cytochrome c oxidase, Cbb3-type, biogenesis protein CcoH n=1 Tax=Rhodobacter capsulatus (strain ATCC BAA-309 / NBRC 16581 / SB1003) TaxID=272942 RepID=D5ARP9_RHOCB|nr:nitrogen fixation protein FixH [Rhodobacter capsulatus]6XKW_h Chain h, Cytochrome c oxidase, Cbb3-type, biogenesis protein CcoH [Rhodobacter capsulatus SB 1003]ADE84920.1 cytochrome c oxidase, Cbb3-type, biogenesis protein CcoH [Rhodobacter capsulatus SB 1003]ETD02359.1 RdxH [Rhodobacter capsulatus DE442]ETD77650.1 RdxH [Rhodobacter capsulatus R121]ETD81719.1 RdxH [Rhodobacter capsulatus YW1]ETD86838.1 RdxH [Rhodobacter capsulatus B6]
MAKPLTGRKVLLMFVAFFGLIIAVNVTMAVQAVKTFPGLEVANSYVASQTFDADRAAQERLGWTVKPAYADGVLSLDIRDRAGQPAPLGQLEVLVGRTTMAAEDRTPQMTRTDGVYSAPLSLAPGAWLIHLSATSADGVLFRQRLDFFVEG